MNIVEIIAGIFKPAAKLVDDLHTSEEEKGLIQLELNKAQWGVAVQFLDYEKQLLQNKTDIIVAEAKGGGVLQRNWRPVTMLTFLALVCADSFGWLATPLAGEAWTLLQIGLGGYVVGRSVEKTMPSVKEIFKK